MRSGMGNAKSVNTSGNAAARSRPAPSRASVSPLTVASRAAASHHKSSVFGPTWTSKNTAIATASPPMASSDRPTAGRGRTGSTRHHAASSVAAHPAPANTKNRSSVPAPAPQ